MSTAAQRMANPMRGVIYTMLATLGVVALVVVWAWRPSPDPVKNIAYEPAVVQARAANLYPIAAPPAPIAGWRATAVDFSRSPAEPAVATWHLGFVTTNGKYVGIDQTNGDASPFISQITGEAKKAQTTEIDGVVWNQYPAPSGGNVSLVRTADGVTTIITGTVSYAELADFEKSLQYLPQK